MAFSFEHALRSAITIALTSTAACSVILDPERHDDVTRCRYDTDCPESDDPRFEPICTVAEGYVDPDFPKICAPTPSLSCLPSDYPGGSTLRRRYGDAQDHPEHYEDRCAELGGVQGCPPADGCVAGLSLHPVSGRCDDDDDDTPPAIMPQPSVLGQDVLDQFCRSAYCSTAMVCHRKLDTCVACELGRSIGGGGCGELYPEGTRSPIYVPDEVVFEGCGDIDADLDAVAIGEFPDADVPERDIQG